MKPAPIVLEADVYDTLEFSALVFGGIGASSYGTNVGRAHSSKHDVNDPPVCAVGHAAFAEIPGDWWRLLPDGTITTSDNAVRNINKRRGKLSIFGEPSDDRVSFKAWARELNVVRGDQ